MILSILLIWLSLSTIFGRQFIVDYENDTFLKDGQKFQYVSGSIHYFRVPQILWKDRLTSLRSMGANAVQTYIEWSSHETEPGIYTFDGDKDFVEFIKTAQETGLLVILRIGPFIAAERDFGGHPYWLFRTNPSMKLRTNDGNYKSLVERWFSVMLPKIRPLLYSNGGPVIMAQVENEYGNWGVCNQIYKSWLRDVTKKYLVNDVVLFTTDGQRDSQLKCGKIDGVFSTVDFGTAIDPSEPFSVLRRHQKHGPLVNSELYTGWIDHWKEKHHLVKPEAVIKSMDKILSMNASVNLYMFHGGTSFGFGASANTFKGRFQTCTTSYDYDAPLNEAGDPTPKFEAIKKIVTKYLPDPGLPVPAVKPKMNIDPFKLTLVMDIFVFVSRFSYPGIFKPAARSFESISQPNGYLLYTTKIDGKQENRTKLRIPGLRDRAHVFVDRVFQGILSREEGIFELLVSASEGSELKLLVENQGRISSGKSLMEQKGLIGPVQFGPLTLQNWTHFKVPLELPEVINSLDGTDITPISPPLSGSPAFFKGSFVLSCGDVHDTFLYLKGWSKGVAFLNGFNLGRYWPTVGPQVTLYAPAHLFRRHPEKNVLLLFEEEPLFCQLNGTCQLTAQFVDHHILNSTVPRE